MGVSAWPPVPAPVAGVLALYPLPMRTRLLELRELIYAVAAATKGVGPLTETLKWGEPAYLTEATKSGTTIRLGIGKSPHNCAVLFNCKTTLIETFRRHFADELVFEGNRAIVVSIDGLLPRALLTLCLRAALTYHLHKGSRVLLTSDFG